MFRTVEIKEVKEKIGDLMKIKRKQMNLTQIELADKLGVSRNTIQNLESGKNFTIDTLFKVMKHFDLLEDVHRNLVQVKKDWTEIKSLY